MSGFFEKHRNANGTYNGVTAMAELTGLSAAEIKWTFERLRQLMHVDKKPKDEALVIVKEEAKGKPWLAQSV